MYRIGLHVYPSAPFWVEVNEAICQRLGDDVVTVELQDPFLPTSQKRRRRSRLRRSWRRSWMLSSASGSNAAFSTSCSTLGSP